MNRIEEIKKRLHELLPTTEYRILNHEEESFKWASNYQDDVQYLLLVLTHLKVYGGIDMKEINVGLKKKSARTLKRSSDGVWILDGKVIGQEEAIGELVEAVEDLGYWCQVAKDVLPKEEFEEVQRAYEYHEE